MIGCLLLSWPADAQTSKGRDLGCSKMTGRAQEICNAVAESLEWNLFGHATIAPGYKPSLEGIRKVYCRLKISKADQDILQKMQSDSLAKEWRLESSADFLLKMIAAEEGMSQEDKGSIFNPHNSNYILKKGCP